MTPKEQLKVNIIEADYNNEQHFSEVLHIVETVGPEFVPPIHKRTTNELFAHYLFGEGEYVNVMWGCTPLRPTVYIAYYNDKPIAISSCFGYIPKVKGAFLSSTMVLKEYRRKGVAHQLMLARLKKLISQNVKKVTVKSWSTNIASIGNLKKVGFEIESVNPDERGPGIDGLVLSQYLNT